MLQSTYESHHHPDPGFPIIFHLDTLRDRGQCVESLHWHDNVELLFCIEGAAVVVSNTDRIPMTPGDLAVVNSDHLHTVYSDCFCQYYCLIADKSLFAPLNLPFGDLLLQSKVTDGDVQSRFQRIIREMNGKLPYYKTTVIAEVLALASGLCRCFAAEECSPDGSRRDNRVEMVKSAVSYIRHHCCEELTIDEICRHVGFSKFYFCRTFKEITGSTVISYINYLRCQNARSLLSTGQYNISESAERSGFNNMSYFTRTYKALMGVLPSAQRVFSEGNRP